MGYHRKENRREENTVKLNGKKITIVGPTEIFSPLMWEKNWKKWDFFKITNIPTHIILSTNNHLLYSPC